MPIAVYSVRYWYNAVPRRARLGMNTHKLLRRIYLFSYWRHAQPLSLLCLWLSQFSIPEQQTAKSSACRSFTKTETEADVEEGDRMEKVMNKKKRWGMFCQTAAYRCWNGGMVGGERGGEKGWQQGLGNSMATTHSLTAVRSRSRSWAKGAITKRMVMMTGKKAGPMKYIHNIRNTGLGESTLGKRMYCCCCCLLGR